ILVDGTPLLAFTFDQGHLFLTVRVYDDNDQLILCVDQNQLQYSISPWDIELEGRSLIIRERARKFLINLVFDPPNRVEVRRGRFTFHGMEFIVYPKRVCFANTSCAYRNNGYGNCDIAFAAGELPLGQSAAVYIPTQPWSPMNRKSVNKWLREEAA